MTTPERNVIKPTVGRKVWFRLNNIKRLSRFVTQAAAFLSGSEVPSWATPFVKNPDQPLDATVVYVHSNRLVNLAINDHYGSPFVATDVPLLQEGDEKPASGYYCEWMPYQIGQAKKEALPAVRSNPPWEHGKAPRVTPEDVDNEIVGETYTVMPSGRVTVCELTLRNGFTVRGESGVVFVENNVPELGRQYAREDAVRKVWPLLGYALREKHS